MAATLISRVGAVAATFRKATIHKVIGLAIDGSARQSATTAPTISAGTGVPTEASPNGSIYTRTDASGAAAAIYAMIGGTWTAIDGS